MLKRLSIILILAISAFFFLKPSPPKYYLSVCAIFRDESRFLREWIEYHRLIGIEHFYLFNNLSQDNYLPILKPYIDQGLVELYDWPYQGKTQDQWNKIQCRAYKKLINEKKNQTFWLAIIDTDEFILPLQTPSLSQFLKDYEPYSGLAINWQLYGTSDIKHIPDNKTLIGTLTKKAPEDFHTNKFVKSIVQPKKVKKIDQPHFCKYKKPFCHVTENFTPFPVNSLTPNVSVHKIRINHYTYRDEDFFYQEKVRRYLNWFPNNPPPFIDPQLNSIEDTSITLFLPELEKRLFN